MKLAEMSWDEVEDYLARDDRIVVPVGSTEQHGRKGALGTDHIIPEGLAVALAGETGTVAAPALPFGVSEHHMAFPGTVTLTSRTFISVVEEVFESLYRHGFRRFFVLNGHGGNSAPLQCLFLDLCNRRLDLKVRCYTWWTLPGVVELEGELFGSEGICHASPGEISLAEAVRPSTGKLKKVPPGIVVERSDTFMTRTEQRRLYPDGVLGTGDQNLSDPHKGQKMFDRIMDGLRQRFRDF